MSLFEIHRAMDLIDQGRSLRWIYDRGLISMDDFNRIVSELSSIEHVDRSFVRYQTQLAKSCPPSVCWVCQWQAVE